MLQGESKVAEQIVKKKAGGYKNRYFRVRSANSGKERDT